MAKKRRLTDAEFDRQYEAARREPAEPFALEASYRPDFGRIRIELSNECAFEFPPGLVEGLADAPKGTIAEVEVLPGGSGLLWKSLDLDLSVTGLLMGSFGTRAWMQEIGRKGGQSTSDAKVDAARRNGRSGGRPPSSRRGKVERRAPSHPDEPDSDYLYGDSTEAAPARSAPWAVVAGEEEPTTPDGHRTPPSSTTPSSRTPGWKAA